MRIATPCCHSRAKMYPKASSVAIPRKTEMVRKLEARSARRVIRSDFIGSSHARGSIGRLPDAMESPPPEPVEDPCHSLRSPDLAQSKHASTRTQGRCRDRPCQKVNSGGMKQRDAAKLIHAFGAILQQAVKGQISHVGCNDRKIDRALLKSTEALLGIAYVR